MTLTIGYDGTSPSAYSGVIQNGSGTVSLTKSGVGELTLAAKNTYTGGTTVDFGTLSLTNGDNDGRSDIGTGTLTINSGGIVTTTGHNPFGYNGGIVHNIVLNAGTLFVSSAYCSADHITMNGGTISGDGSLDMMHPDGSYTTKITATAAGTANLVSVNYLMFGAGTTMDTVGAAGLTVSSVIREVPWDMSGYGLIKEGTGTLTLSGTDSNTYTGTTTLNAGNLYFGKTAGAVAITGPVAINNNGNPNLRMSQNNQFSSGATVSWSGITGFGRFDLNGTSQTIAGISASSDVYSVIQNQGLVSGETSQSGTLTVNTAFGHSYSFIGLFRDEDGGGHTYKLNFVKDGPGTQSLSADGADLGNQSYITYTGTTTVNGGTLITDPLKNFRHSTLWNSSSIVVNNGGTIQVGTQFNSFVGFEPSAGQNIYINSGGTIINTTGVNNANGLSHLIMDGGELKVTGASDTLYGNWLLDYGVSTPGTSGSTSSISGGTAALAQTGGTVFDIGIGDTLNVSAALIHTVGADTGLTKTGTGTLILSGTNTYTGATGVSAGMLIVNGSIQTSSLTTVSSGATLQGSGTTGALTVNGTLSPGNSPGTLSSVGTVTYAGGGSYTWEINDATGTAGSDPGWDTHAITGGLTVGATSGNKFTISITSLTLGNVAGDAANFNKKNNYVWTITSASTGISGFSANAFTLDASSFTNDTTGVFQNGQFGIQMSGDLLELLYYAAVDSTDFSKDAVNDNASAVGAVLDNITNPTGDMANVINTLQGLSGSQVGSALSTMTPDVSSGSMQASQQATNGFLGTVANRLGYARDGLIGLATGEMIQGVGFWIQGLGNNQHQGQRDGIQGFNANSFGTTIGADKMLGNHVRAGLAGGYGLADVNSKMPGSPSDSINSWSGIVYGSFDSTDLEKSRHDNKNSRLAVRNQLKDNWYVDGLAGFTENNYDSRREIWIAPSNKRVAKADHHGQQYTTKWEAGYTFVFEATKNLETTPFTSLQYSRLQMNRYKENGADSMNLTVDGTGYNQLLQTLGTKFAYPIVSKKAGTFIPSVKAAWMYDYLADQVETNATFAGGGSSFTSKGAKPAKSGLLLGAELGFLNKGNVTLTANYDLELKEAYTSNTYYLTARFDF